jgi:hypothetical protein
MSQNFEIKEEGMSETMAASLSSSPTLTQEQQIQQLQTMAAYASEFTQVQMTEAYSAHLTQTQRTSLMATATAHDAAVEAAKVALKAVENADKATRLAEERKKTAEKYQKEYEEGNDSRKRIKTEKWGTVRGEEAKQAAKDAKVAENLAFESRVTVDKAIEFAASAIEKANKAECDNAKVVLKADLTAEVARVVRMFGSGMIQERTVPDENYHSEVFSMAYSILAEFILMLKETKCVDMLVPPKREKVVKLVNSLKVCGFKGKWLKDVRKAVSNDSTLLLSVSDELEKMKVFLDAHISKTEVLIADLESNLSGYQELSGYVTNTLSALQTRLPTYFNTKPPNLPNPPDA